jgi:hypothetical protein
MGHSPVISRCGLLGGEFVSNSLCQAQEKRTMRETEAQIENSD